MRVKIVKEGAESTMGDWGKPAPEETWEDEPAEQAGLPGETVADEPADPDATIPIKKPEDYAANPAPSQSEMDAAMDAYTARNSVPWKHLTKAGFEDVREIGRGHFGVVYSADHPSGREMAVKAIEKDGPGYS